MSLVLTQEQSLMKQAASRLLQDHAPVSMQRSLRDMPDSRGYSQDAWQRMVENGWPAILVPEDYDGLNFGHVGMGQIVEEMGRQLSASPLFSTAVLAATVIDDVGDATLKADFLPRIARGEITMALAINESGQFRPNAVETTASLENSAYTVTGQKHCVIDGDGADYYIVSARTSGESTDTSGISLFIVDASQAGIAIKPQRFIDERNYANVEFASVNSGWSLGIEHEGWAALAHVTTVANAHLSAELLGVVQEAFERTLQYLKERKQFGVPIGSFQALQHRAATMWVEIEQCKSIVLAALQALDARDGDVERLVSAAKAKLSSVAELVTCEAIQLHGGIGMTDEFDIGFFIKRARALQTQFGGFHHHADRYATLSGY
ncbi:MAG: acyl-CoA dehydrogenase family protein [Pseudomonadota bacterium]